MVGSRGCCILIWVMAKIPSAKHSNMLVPIIASSTSLRKLSHHDSCFTTIQARCGLLSQIDKDHLPCCSHPGSPAFPRCGRPEKREPLPEVGLMSSDSRKKSPLTSNLDRIFPYGIWLGEAWKVTIGHFLEPCFIRVGVEEEEPTAQYALDVFLSSGMDPPKTTCKCWIHPSGGRKIPTWNVT